MKKKIETKFFVFEIIPPEFVALICLYKGRILTIGTQCVRKQFWDFAYP